MTLVQEPTNNANGLTRDPQGRLVMCEMGARRVSRVEADGSITVIASSYHGLPLNRPNDVVVKSDGSIYFTDPGGPAPDTDLDFSGVYRVSPDLSVINLLVQDYVLPNGLAFSPDESVLYINDSLGLHVDNDMFRSIGFIDAFDVRPNGMLANRRRFCDLRGEGTGIPDGMKVDVEGNVYCTGSGGVWVMDATGRHLGTILTEVEHTTNMAWGRRRLADPVHYHLRDAGPHRPENTGPAGAQPNSLGGRGYGWKFGRRAFPAHPEPVEGCPCRGPAPCGESSMLSVRVAESRLVPSPVCRRMSRQARLAYAGEDPATVGSLPRRG